MKRGLLMFTAGLAVMLTAGWVGFPRVLYSKKQQPLEFRHKTHAEKSGTAECQGCHELKADGVFAGLPATESCAGCHAEAQGQSKAEAALVAGFVKTGKEVPWLVYARQPANVRFSHAIHIKRANLKCERCHGTQGGTDEVRTFEQNRISGYSREIWGHSISRLRNAKNEGMKMSDCERCHAERGFETGCLGCHQ